MKIVILHGWGQNKEVWNELSNKLKMDIMAIDLPGFGREKIVDNNWGVPEYAKWVENQIKDYKSVILIGHSFGGRITTEIAGKRPNYLKAIVLSGSPSIYRPTLSTRLKIFVSKFGKFIIPHKLRMYLLPRDLRKAVNIDLEKTFKKVVKYDQTKQLNNITIPTLLIWGSDDKVVPIKIAQEINKLIKNSSLKVIDKAGHNSFLDNPNLFYSYVKKFIETVK